VASEYRYRDSVPNPNALIVTISQSGETADTLAALKHAKSLGHANTLSICNAPESALVRESGLRFLTVRALKSACFHQSLHYPIDRITVAGTGAGKLRGRISTEQETAHLESLRHLPSMVNQVLLLEPQIELWAERMAFKQHALFLGRGLHTRSPMEGALKLKEISYIPCRSLPGGRAKARPASAGRQRYAGGRDRSHDALRKN